MGVEDGRTEEGRCSPESVAGESNIRRAIELIYSLISHSHSVKVFAGKWQSIRSKLEELNSGLVAAENCDSGENPQLSDLIPAILSAAGDCRDLARRCVDLSYSGKLLMQSDLDLISARFDVLIKDLAGIYSAGILTHGRAIVVSKPNPGADRDDLRFYMQDLFTRMKIGDTQMKIQALASLNEALIEDERYGKLLAGVGDGGVLLAKFLNSPEMEVREAAAAAVCSVSGLDSCRAVLISAGIVAPLISVLEGGSDLGKVGAARALQKLTLNADNAWAVSAHGGVTALLRLCGAGVNGCGGASGANGGGGGGGELPGLACGVLKNLCGVEEIKKFMVEEGAVSIFIKLARSKDESLQINSIEILQILASGDEPIKQMLFKEGGIRVLVRMLDPKTPYPVSSKAKEIALRAVQSLCLSDCPSQNCINILINYGLLDHLLYHLRNGDCSVQDQALRVAIRFCGISEETKKAMGDAGFMPELVKLLGAKSFEVREMAAEGLAGIVSVSRNRRRFVQEDGNVGLVLRLLNPEEGNDSSSGSNRKFLLSTLMTLSGCNSGRKKIASSGYVKNLEKLAEAEVSDAKKIVRKLSSNRFRSILSGIWHS